ncbi:FadR/GntR family transcriptional regulator [Mycobacterium colombiense]
MVSRQRQADIAVPPTGRGGATSWRGATPGDGEEGGRSRAQAARLARRIESDIADAGWPVGQVFGSESDLRSRYGVSREVLREAIRLVEAHEVAVMRRGPAGGLVVTAPAAAPATWAMAVYLENVGATVDDLMAARLLLEPLAARLASEHLTEEGLARLTGCMDDPADDAESGCPDDGLHLLLPHLGGNAALALFVEILVRLTEHYMDRTSGHGSAPAGRQAHRAIGAAVASGEGGLAETLTAQHIAALRTAISGAGQLAIDRSGVGRLRAALVSRGGQKLAEKIAFQLIERIIDTRIPVGALVGSEADLVQQMNVSPAVLREAVRIIEYHSVARMRLGPGGGLVVVEPDPTPITETMAIYLDYMKVTAHDVLFLRTTLEQACVVTVVERCKDESVAERLRAAGEVKVSEERSLVGHFLGDLHTELAALSGNPILELFTGIVRQIWSRHVKTHDLQPSDRDEESRQVEHDHRRIMEAILAGDGPLARILLREHLKGLPLSIVREQAAC